MRNIWPWELAEGKCRTSSKAKAVVPKLHFFTPRDLYLHCVVSAALQLTWISFHSWSSAVFCQDGGGTQGWSITLRCRSWAQTCRGLQVCFPPSPGLPAAGSPLAMWGRNACAASWGFVLHPPLISWMNLTVSWYLHANAEKTQRVRLRFAAESLGFARMPDPETLQRASRGWRHKG